MSRAVTVTFRLTSMFLKVRKMIIFFRSNIPPICFPSPKNHIPVVEGFLKTFYFQTERLYRGETE